MRLFRREPAPEPIVDEHEREIDYVIPGQLLRIGGRIVSPGTNVRDPSLIRALLKAPEHIHVVYKERESS